MSNDGVMAVNKEIAVDSNSIRPPAFGHQHSAKLFLEGMCEYSHLMQSDIDRFTPLGGGLLVAASRSSWV
jgi:hypothetical protein